MEKSLTFVTNIDTGERAYEGLFLVNSIHRYHEDPEIIVFVPEEAKDSIKDEIIEEIEQKAKVISGKTADYSYGLSVKHTAFARASEIAETSHLVYLDSDTLVLDEINLHNETEADIAIKPTDNGSHYWARQEKGGELEEICERHGFDFPEERTRSDVDNREIWPYYNAGVILIRNEISLPQDWKEFAEELHKEITHKYFAGQVSLALLAQEYEVEELDSKYNYPISFTFWCPSDTKIIHYRAFPHLYKVLNPAVKKKMKDTGIVQKLKEERGKEYYLRGFMAMVRAVKIQLMGFKKND